MEKKKYHVLTILPETYGILLSDLHKVIEELQKNRSDYNRRQFIRTFGTFIDGVIFQYKVATLELDREIFSTLFQLTSSDALSAPMLSYESRLTPEEKIILEEIAIEVSPSGNLERKSRFMNFEKSLRFTVKSFLKVIGSNFDPNYANYRWGSLKRTVQVRNRLTHPKKPEDLQITEKELKDADEAVNWFAELIRDLLDSLKRSIKAQSKELNDFKKAIHSMSLTRRE